MHTCGFSNLAFLVTNFNLGVFENGMWKTAHSPLHKQYININFTHEPLGMSINIAINDLGFCYLH